MTQNYFRLLLNLVDEAIDLPYKSKSRLKFKTLKNGDITATFEASIKEKRRIKNENHTD